VEWRPAAVRGAGGAPQELLQGGVTIRGLQGIGADRVARASWYQLNMGICATRNFR
jgi:hypothetical protein